MRAHKQPLTHSLDEILMWSLLALINAFVAGMALQHIGILLWNSLNSYFGWHDVKTSQVVVWHRRETESSPHKHSVEHRSLSWNHRNTHRLWVQIRLRMAKSEIDWMARENVRFINLARWIEWFHRPNHAMPVSRLWQTHPSTLMTCRIYCFECIWAPRVLSLLCHLNWCGPNVIKFEPRR